MTSLRTDSAYGQVTAVPAADVDLAALLDGEVRAIATGTETGLVPVRPELPVFVEAAASNQQVVPVAGPAMAPRPEPPAEVRAWLPAGVLAAFSRGSAWADQQGTVLADISYGRISALHKQIDELYERVVKTYSSQPDVQAEMLPVLRAARQTLVERPEAFFDAEYLVVQIRADLEGREVKPQRGGGLKLRLLGYQLLWVAIFVAGLFFSERLIYWLVLRGTVSGITATGTLIMWMTMMWGGIGGVASALYHLWVHAARYHDLGHQHLNWHLFRSLIGMGLGAIIFLLVVAALLAGKADLVRVSSNVNAEMILYLGTTLLTFSQPLVQSAIRRPPARSAPVGQRTR